jgi:hypothetical protein
MPMPWPENLYKAAVPNTAETTPEGSRDRFCGARVFRRRRCMQELMWVPRARLHSERALEDWAEEW